MLSGTTKLQSHKQDSKVSSGSFKSILLIGPLPPLLGGQSILNKSILESSINDSYILRSLNVGLRDINIISRGLLTLRYCAHLAFILIQHRDIALLHIHTQATLGFYEKSILVLLSQMFRRKTVLHIHGGRFRAFWRNAGKLNKHLIKWLLERNDAIIVLSSSWKKFYEEEISCQIPIKILPNAVTTPIRTDTVKSSSHKTILYAGHLKPEKGLLDLLETLKLLKPTHGNTIELQLMGKGDTIENETLIREAFTYSDLPEVKMLGALEGSEKWKAFHQADVFVLPSHSEDMPLSILEAMAVGKPVIATTVGLIPEVIEHGVNGFLVPPHNPPALAETLRLLLDKPDLCRAMSSANLEKIERFYSFGKLEERLKLFYRQILGAEPN